MAEAVSARTEQTHGNRKQCCSLRVHRATTFRHFIDLFTIVLWFSRTVRVAYRMLRVVPVIRLLFTRSRVLTCLGHFHLLPRYQWADWLRLATCVSISGPKRDIKFLSLQCLVLELPD